MPRNLDRRVEVLVRVDDPILQSQLQEILDVSLADDHLSWELDSDGVWARAQRPQGLDSQQWFQHSASGSVAG